VIIVDVAGAEFKAARRLKAASAGFLLRCINGLVYHRWVMRYTSPSSRRGQDVSQPQKSSNTEQHKAPKSSRCVVDQLKPIAMA
jgi:hypothetical protein